MKMSSRFSQSIIAWGSVVFAAMIVININFLVENAFPLAELDLTDEQLYTISDGTKQTLAELDEPITIRVYYSTLLGERSAPVREHFERVKTMLDQYADLADGRLIIDYLDPVPFSVIEDEAVAGGLTGIPATSQGELGYFGIVASNSVDDQASIPFVDIGRDKFLEYDVTSRIHELANPEKPIVGMIAGIGIEGDPDPQASDSDPWRVLEQVRQFFELETLVTLAELPTKLDKIPDHIDVLLLAQPLAISEATVYAIDQFVLGGGNVVLFADPSATIAAGIAYDETMIPLLRAWGIEIDREHIAADRENGQRVRMNIDGNIAVTNLVIWPAFSADDISNDDVAVAGIEKLNTATPGAITILPGAEDRVTPLIRTSEESMMIEVEKVRRQPIPAQLLRDFVDSGERYPVAVRISGNASSAFPDGPPKADNETAQHIESGEVNAIVFSDIDFLDDRFWVSTRELFGREVITPTADNAAFLTNALENLTGQPLLIGLRGRGVDDRPFELIQKIQREAERDYRGQEQTLADELERVEARLSELESSGALFLSSADQQLVIDARKRSSEIRREMRDVRLALRNEIDGLSLWIRVINIGGMPAALTFAAIVVVGWRRNRRRNKPYQAMGG